MNRNRVLLLSLSRDAVLAAIVAASLLASSCAFGYKEDMVPTISGEDKAVYAAGRCMNRACMWIVTAFTGFDLPNLPGTTHDAGADPARMEKMTIVCAVHSPGVPVYSGPLDFFAIHILIKLY